MKILDKILTVEKICNTFQSILLNKSKRKDWHKTIQATNNQGDPIVMKQTCQISSTTTIKTNTNSSKIKKDLPRNRNITWNKNKAEI
jgi:hypothetical protein